MKKTIISIFLIFLATASYANWYPEYGRFIHKNFTVWLPEKPKIEKYEIKGLKGKGNFIDLEANYKSNEKYPDLRTCVQFGKLPLSVWNDKDDEYIALTILMTAGEEFTDANYWTKIYQNTKKVPSPIAGDSHYLSEFEHLGAYYKIRIVIGKPYIWVFMSGTYVLADENCKKKAQKFWQSIGLSRGDTPPPFFRIRPDNPKNKK